MTFRLAPQERQKRWSVEDSVPHFGQYMMVFTLPQIATSNEVQKFARLVFGFRRIISRPGRLKPHENLSRTGRLAVKIKLEQKDRIKENRGHQAPSFDSSLRTS
jgi:hypothetical protein